MPHLSPERIAALVDEPATGDERVHLDGCARCRADFVAVRRIVAAAGAERDRTIAPLVPWQQMATALRSEGLLGAGGASAGAGRDSHPDVRPITSAPSVASAAGAGGGRRWWSRPGAMAAAAALLVTVGVAGGRLSVRRDAGPTVLPAGEGVAAAIPHATTAQPVAVRFRNPDDARAMLATAEEVYSGALLWLAAHDSALAPRQAGGSAAAAMNYRARLEVLDAAMATARRALYEAPDDPVMNRYYLATLGAREVTLRRLTTVLPASQQVLEY
ncbi:MAG: hypothetical protein IT355_03815 [Gemmatimonadaceae bacterium]|nr:hypothetical protein [Gemmatimonadaceae bacterium]